MDAKQIRRLKPMLAHYLRQFDDCFAQRQTRAHFSTYVEGQLSDLGEKSCEPIAVAAGIPPRNLQEFLSTYKWEEDRARNRLQEIVIRDHSGRNSVGIIDETSDVKQGTKTPGVKQQWLRWSRFSDRKVPLNKVETDLTNQGIFTLSA